MEKIMLCAWVCVLCMFSGTLLVAAESSSATRPVKKALNSSPISFCGRVIQPKELEKVLLSQEEFHPFPTIDERKEWDSLSAELRQSLIRQGEKNLDFQWPNLPVVGYLDFCRDGNRTRFQAVYFARREALVSLVVAECVENKGRFLDQILNGLWAVCEETSWVVPAHMLIQRDGQPLPDIKNPVIDISAGETGSTLACVAYLMESRFEKISPLVNKRLYDELKKRIIDPYLDRDDFWWFGFNGDRRSNNWNPWCNCNCFATVLLMEKDQNRRVQAVLKGFRSLNRFIQGYPSDGGCDEGPHYWGVAGGCLFEYLNFLKQSTNGKIDFFDQELVKRIGQYIYRVHIHDDYYINFADSLAKIKMNPDLLYRYGKRVGDDNLVNLGVAVFPSNRKFEGHAFFQSLFFIFDYDVLAEYSPVKQSYVRDVWLDGIQVMAAREKEGDYHGFYLAAKGGHNAESHNHNDVGNFIVYYDGKPMIIDVGVESYTAKTFSPQRYEIWTMQSQYHNLPRIKQVDQQAGAENKAEDVKYTAGYERTELSMELASAYPSDAGVRKLRRAFTLNRNDGGSIDICDNFELQQPTEDIMWTLMIACEHRIDNKAGVLTLKLGEKTIAVSFDPSIYICQSEKITILDERLFSVWGDHLFRILFKAKKPMKEGEWKIHFDEKL